MEKEKKSKHFVHQPEFPGGPKALTEFIYKHLKYPEAALKANVEGIVYAEIEINHKGEVISVRILQGIGHGCDEEAARVLGLLQFNVSRTRGVKVTFHKKLKVQFKKPKVQPKPAPTQVAVQYNYTQEGAKTPEPKKQDKVFSYTITFNDSTT